MKKLGKVAVIAFLAVIIIGGFSVPIAKVSGGKLGTIFIEGDSMEGYPNGSVVILWPRTAKPGNIVSAWANLPTGVPGPYNEASQSEDFEPTLVIKLYDGKTLRSTASKQEINQFDLRGVVIAHWNPPWNHSGASAPDPSVRNAFPDEEATHFLNERERAQKAILDSRMRWIKSRCASEDYVMEEPSIRDWQWDTNKRYVYMVEVTAETPYVLALYENGEKEAELCSPPAGKLVPLFTTREQPLTGKIRIAFEEADSPPPPTKLHRVRLWVSTHKLNPGQH